MVKTVTHRDSDVAIYTPRCDARIARRDRKRSKRQPRERRVHQDA